MRGAPGESSADSRFCCARAGGADSVGRVFPDRKDIARAVLVGHSVGRLVAEHVALRHPERVSRLVLIGTGAGTAGNPFLLDLQRSVADGPVPLSPEFLAE